MAFNIKETVEQALGLLFPRLCVHCNSRVPKAKLLFCPTCLEQISLIDVQERCRTCFAELHKGRCERCIHRPVVIQHQLAACETMGPAHTLLNGIHGGKRECISPAASLMAYQWLEQKMLLPDLLIPFPVSFWQKQKHGFDANFLLAEKIGEIFSTKVQRVLKRKFDRRHFLTEGELAFYYRLNHKGPLCDLRLLLIAPILDDAQLRRAGIELKSHFPAQIDALAFSANGINFH